MQQILAIAGGGALGAVLRFGMSNVVYRMLGRDFPYGTLAVNVLGSLLMGFLFVVLLERIVVSAEWRAALLVGLLGAFTTFSTFSFETLALFEGGEPVKAITNIALSVFLCLAATWLGLSLGRQL
ncbi:MAG: fluoride efflux transporter CrcB [Gammaproteobacteria bacterium]|nr:MAG: fluoride efflux transporter CrcB [Gammaproteobacteria bacterium]